MDDELPYKENLDIVSVLLTIWSNVDRKLKPHTKWLIGERYMGSIRKLVTQTGPKIRFYCPAGFDSAGMRRPERFMGFPIVVTPDDIIAVQIENSEGTWIYR